MQDITKQKDVTSEFERLLESSGMLAIPKVGDVIKGAVISFAKNEVRIDIPGFKTGVVRGREIFSESAEVAGIKPGDDVEATVVALENENGDVELSFRSAGHRKAWDAIAGAQTAGTPLEVTIVEANKGGLMVRVNHMLGFLPVSQLAPEHYPRVAGGDKSKILEKLKSFVGQSLKVKVLDANEGAEKLIVSEKAVWEDEQAAVIAKYKIGDTVEGAVTALTDFGAFVKFDALEGLVHISEIAWQRIDHPRDVLTVGQEVKCQVIGIQGSKIFLSMKKLIEDPWKNVGDKYHIGQIVRGKIIKANPFGFFVELDPDIHGLAHVSELSHTPIKDPTDVAKVGEDKTFKIVSIEPDSHRLGLSLKALEEAPKAEEKKEEDKKEEKPAEEKTA
ncbi:S1 RNA-binding domain-containing protein [Patescibacteria group bacterium]|nr:MAG: S1 RNA-binding domain-containing protein [Patescibacteria group bacterium]